MFDENSSMLINRWSRLIFFELLTSAFYSDDSFFMPSWVAIFGHHSEQKPSEIFELFPNRLIHAFDISKFSKFKKVPNFHSCTE